MRLLARSSDGEISLTRELIDNIPAYAILSHTWGPDEDEVTFEDIEKERINNQTGGYAKLQFCGKQAQNDGLRYFWVDTCCINKANHVELSEAITSMFRWYRDAAKCYVFLSDVSATSDHNDRNQNERIWEADFCKSRWFTRGWTLQELLAPTSVDFFSREGIYLGNKKTLEQLVHKITNTPISALQGRQLSYFSVEERLGWIAERSTKRPEDKAYCLLGIFNISMSLRYGEGENEVQRLKDKISKQARNLTVSSVHVHWIVPRSPNPHFTGRDRILQEVGDVMMEAVRHPPTQTQCRIVITGIGGQGKSELCLQLARRLRQWFWGVFWLDVSTRDVAERAFLEAAHKVSLPAQSWEDAREGIANLKHSWLLVLDNADDPYEDYQNYFPDGNLGVVMLSSRNEECQQYATSKAITLEQMTNEEAKDLLFKAARVPPDRHPGLEQDAQVLVSLLQSHALALIQAGAYVSRGHCTFADYPRLYEQQRKRLLTFQPAQAQSRYRDVYATFEVSANVLKNSETEVARDALRLLPLLAICGPQQLPLIGLFEAAWRGAQTVAEDMSVDGEDVNIFLPKPWHVTRLPMLVQAERNHWDSYQLLEALNLLKAFSLVLTDSQGSQFNVSMHPLIHAWARDRQDDHQRHESWLQIGCLIAVGSKDRVIWREYWWQVQSHIEALVLWEIDVMFGQESAIMVVCILINIGCILNRLRSDAIAFELTEKIFAHLSLNRQSVDRRWLGVYEFAARSFINHEKAEEAAAMLEEVVKIKEQTLAPDHPDLLSSQHSLASAYMENGQVEEAVVILEEVVNIEELTLVPDHPDRLASQHSLAVAYMENRQVEEAVVILEEVVKIEEQTLAAGNPDRLASQNGLAVAYRENGQVKEAIAILEEIIKVEEQTLGADNTGRLISQHDLAIALWDAGDYTSALRILTQVVEIRRQVLHTSHPHRQSSEAWLKYMKDKTI